MACLLHTLHSAAVEKNNAWHTHACDACLPIWSMYIMLQQSLWCFFLGSSKTKQASCLGGSAKAYWHDAQCMQPCSPQQMQGALHCLTT